MDRWHQWSVPGLQPTCRPQRSSICSRQCTAIRLPGRNHWNNNAVRLPSPIRCNWSHRHWYSGSPHQCTADHPDEQKPLHCSCSEMEHRLRVQRKPDGIRKEFFRYSWFRQSGRFRPSRSVYHRLRLWCNKYRIYYGQDHWNGTGLPQLEQNHLEYQSAGRSSPSWSIHVQRCMHDSGYFQHNSPGMWKWNKRLCHLQSRYHCWQMGWTRCGCRIIKPWSEVLAHAGSGADLSMGLYRSDFLNQQECRSELLMERNRKNCQTAPWKRHRLILDQKQVLYFLRKRRRQIEGSGYRWSCRQAIIFYAYSWNDLLEYVNFPRC